MSDVLNAIELFRLMDVSDRDAIAEQLVKVDLGVGDVLMQQGEVAAEMYVVLVGKLRAEVAGANGEITTVGKVGKGDTLGEMQAFCGGARNATIVAEEPSTVFRIPVAAINQVVETNPRVARALQQLVRDRIRRTGLMTAVQRFLGSKADVALLDDLTATIDFVDLERGEVLFSEGDESEAIYITVSGLLAVTITGENGARNSVGTIGTYEVFGESGLIRAAKRTGSVHAVRASTVARIGQARVAQLYGKHPELLLALMRNTLRRMDAMNKRKSVRQERTLAVMVHRGWARGREIIDDLTSSMGQNGTVLRVNPAVLERMRVLTDASNLPEDHPGWFRFHVWLEEQRLVYDRVFLECDPTLTTWTREALRVCDTAVICADATSDPFATSDDRLIPSKELYATLAMDTILLLVHPQETALPSGTRHWLDQCKPTRHLHMRLGVRSDLARVGRLLFGVGLGLVLGGGGARGFAHLGVVRALQEAGVPIDMVGGTSMGGIIAAQLGLGQSLEQLIELNWQGVRLQPFTEYTVPVVALMRTLRAERLAEMMFGDSDIEDLWLPYYSISVDIVTGEEVVHTRGPLRTAIRGTSALPGVMVPVFGKGQVLVDGGVLNNLPVDVMSKKGAPVIIAVNVSPRSDLHTTFEGVPSPMAMLAERYLKTSSHHDDVPGIGEILTRCMTLGDARHRKTVAALTDLRLDPPIEGIGLLDFEQLDQLVDIGYRYASEKLASWTVPQVIGNINRS